MSLPASTSTGAPSVRSLVALLVLVGMINATLLVLYVVTPAAQRPDVWGLIAAYAPAIVAAAPAALAYIGIRKVRASNAEQAAQLATIHRNTNGVLDKRIRDGVRDVLTEAGLLPSETVPAQAGPSD